MTKDRDVASCVALLRAVNVGGRAAVSMAQLREMCTSIGLENPRTLLQSGNLVFETEKHSPADLEKELETETADRLGLRTDFLVRTDREWSKLVKANPFPDAARDDPGHLLVVFLKGRPDSAKFDALRAAVKGREEVHGGDRCAYITYPDGVGRSKLTISVIESKLGTRGTGRNWNTVLKLAAFLEQ